MTVRQRKLREHTSIRPRNHPDPQINVDIKRQELKAAQEAYDEACVRKHGKPSVCEELGGFLKTAAKGASIAVKHVGRAAQTMGELAEDDLYRNSLAGQRDKAIIKMLQNDKRSSVRGTGTSTRARNPQYAIYIDESGNPHVVPKSRVQLPTKKTRR